MRAAGSSGVAALVAALAMLLAGGCDGPGDPPDDYRAGDDDTACDDDTAGDDDTEEPCEGTIGWGFASDFTVGEVVGNWSMGGYIDSDLDGQVEPVEVGFTFEDIHCTGVQSLVIIAGDST